MANHTVDAQLVERARTGGGGGRRGGGGNQVATGGGETETETETDPGGGGGGGPAGGNGTLRVQTTPWSQVYVDGRLIGNTPQMNISLPAGRHQVRLINPDFDIRETVSVNIRAGQTETLIRRLTPPG
jgi:serine/threonine-protein kinase